MTPQDIKEIMIQELPKMIEQDQAFRYLILDMVQDKFAEKQETEGWFSQVLQELKHDREEGQRKWEEGQRALTALQEESSRKREEDQRKWEEDQRKWEENQRKWEENQRKWEENQRKWEENQRKWEENQGALTALQEESNRKWEENQRKWEENQGALTALQEESNRKWEESNQRWEEMMEEIKQLNRKHDSTIGALGARWGIHSEQSFRNALKSILEESFAVQVLNVTEYDAEGEVFGRPDQIELDIIIKNGLLIIVEIKSSISKSDMYTFSRKVAFYEKGHHCQAMRKIVISPMVDEYALPVAKRLGIEVYSYAEDVETS